MPCHSPSGMCDQTTCVIESECAWKGIQLSTEEFWRGEFGNEYTKRNRVDWRARIPFWRHIIDKTGARSVFELGCNAGWNLSAIRRACPDVNILGFDVNQQALKIAETAGIKSEALLHMGSIELVFTAGVLIHVPPEELKDTMDMLVLGSCDYVLAVEYESEEETEVEYRGHSGKLWKRPYGKLYQDMGLELVETGSAEGFDNCTYWLMRKL